MREFADETFDMIICHNVLEYAEDRADIVKDGTASFKSIEEAAGSKNAIKIGRFSCKGYNTFGHFKLMGGISKRDTDSIDLNGTVEFFKGLY